MEEVEASARLWRWISPSGKAAWYFITISGQAADDIRASAMMGPWLTGRRGFGSVRVQAQIGDTLWATSLFPHKESEGWLLPVKASVRRAEGLEEGDEVALTLRL